MRFVPLPFLLSCALLGADHTTMKADAPTPSAAPAARAVPYGERDVVPVRARLRYTTLLILPKEEQILDYVCGDKEFWVVNGNQNFAYVKPAKAGARSNLNLITASGNVYSFLLTEVGDTADPDLKLYIEPRDESIISAIGKRRLFSADDVEQYRERADAAEKQVKAVRAEAAQQVRTAQDTAETTVAKVKSEAPAKLRFTYRYRANEAPFLVSSIYHDERFTYIKADPEETPALYEIKDGKPNLITFEFRDGVYFVPKILDTGYLEIGKKKLNFYRKED
jgi:type IV secretory pathway VirB9-like protein